MGREKRCDKRLAGRKNAKNAEAMNKFLKFWLPVILWAGIIFWLSSIPDLESGLKQDFILRKIAHILEFAFLTFLLLRAISAEVVLPKRIVIYAVIFALFYALTDEYHQSFVLGRQCSLKDVGIDSIGILITGLVWYIKDRKNPPPIKD
jgi:VanZ family protein